MNRMRRRCSNREGDQICHMCVECVENRGTAPPESLAGVGGVLESGLKKKMSLYVLIVAYLGR